MIRIFSFTGFPDTWVSLTSGNKFTEDAAKDGVDAISFALPRLLSFFMDRLFHLRIK